VFESAQLDGAAQRLRSAALAPTIAVLVWLLHRALDPVLYGGPAALAWVVAAILCAGAVAGAIGIGRVALTERIRGRAIGWLVIALLAELLCAHIFVAVAFPRF